MADYNKATNFTAKDGLPTGNPAKIVKGTEIDIELTAVASAVASKADINSPALTGTPTTPTAEAGTNTLQIASTEFVTRALQSAYPIGSIYINASSNASPTVLLGFGTWVAFGAGRVMVGQNASDALFDTLEETGGSKDAVVVSHTHIATSVVTDPGHTHTESAVNNFDGAQTLSNGVIRIGGNRQTGSSVTGITVATTNASTGVSGTNANLQPYITVNMWKRTA